MKDLGDAKYILGTRIYKDRFKCLIELSQSTYLDKILKKFRIQDSKKGFLHMQHDIKLIKDQCPNTIDEIDCNSRKFGLEIQRIINYKYSFYRIIKSSNRIIVNN